MQIYNHHPVTGEFVGVSMADANPLYNPEAEGDSPFLIPADATEDAPPSVGANQAAVFVGDEWSIVADHRGEIWFQEDRTPVLIETLGNPADDDLLEEQPPEPEPIEPEPGSLPPRLVASAMNVAVDGGDISSVEGVFGLAGAIYLDTGLYMLLFLNTQPDENFYAVISGGAPCMGVTEKNVDYLMIEAKDGAAGAAVDPAQFSVKVFRV